VFEVRTEDQHLHNVATCEEQPCLYSMIDGCKGRRLRYWFWGSFFGHVRVCGYDFVVVMGIHFVLVVADSVPRIRAMRRHHGAMELSDVVA
jgi:hypothetical protein